MSFWKRYGQLVVERVIDQERRHVTLLGTNAIAEPVLTEAASSHHVGEGQIIGGVERDTAEEVIPVVIETAVPTHRPTAVQTSRRSDRL